MWWACRCVKYTKFWLPSELLWPIGHDGMFIALKKRMPNLSHKICCRLLSLLLLLGTVVPMNASAADSSADYLDYLGTDAAIISILISNALLLLGFLFRLQDMRKTLFQTNSALEKSERHLRVMGDNLPNITTFQLEYVPDLGFSFRYISKGYERMLGIDRDRVMNDAKLAFDHLYEADIPALKKAYLLAEETLGPIDLDIRMLDISGNLKWLRVSAVPRREEDTLVWDGIVQDVSDKKNTENALIEEKHNLQNLFETIDDLLLVCDMNGRLLHSNPSVKSQLGYALEELVEMSLPELYPEHFRTEACQIIALMQSEPSSNCDLPLQMKNGGTISVEMNIFQGSWKNRQAIFAVARNTTQRRQTEIDLHESQQMLQLIMDTIPMSVFWKDKDSTCLGCNKAFMQECAIDHVDNIIGKPPHDLFGPDTSSTLMAHDQQVINTNQPMFNVLHSHSRRDGSPGWREISKIPLHNEEGQVVGVLDVWRDVTEQSLAEERLKRTLEDMERFNQLMRGRERRTLELKAEVNRLLEELGRQVKYQTTTDKLT